MYRLLSPSSLHRRERCPGSYRLEKAALAKRDAEPKKVSEHPEGSVDFAGRGSDIHDSIAQGLKFPKDRQDILAAISELHDIESVEIVRRCWDEAEAVWASFTPEQQKLCKVYIEKELDTEDVGLDGAKLDYCVIYAGTELEAPKAVIRDWKSGMGFIPSARYNLQLLCYAACVLRTEREDAQYDIGVFSPAKRDTVDKWLASKADIAAVRDRIRHITTACEKPDAPCYSGGWCEFCASADSCAVRMQVAVEVKQICDPVATFKSLQPAQKTEYYERLLDAAKRLQGAKDDINAMILDGSLVILGYEIGPGKVSRSWKDSDVQVIGKLRAIAGEKGIPLHDVEEPISPAAAEKLLSKKSVEKMIISNPGKLAVKRSKA